jgi:hypothetical protein
MALNSVYRKYFQKSQVFLYPILGIKRGAACVPSSTYVAWDENNSSSEDMKLICVYDYEESHMFDTFVKTVLLKHPRLFGYVKIDSKTNVFTFDLSDLGADWENFLKGKYSKMNLNLKNKILNFFDPQSGNYQYVKSYLYPEKYYNEYADLLNTNVELLKSVVELCTKPDLAKETLQLEIANLGSMEESAVNLLINNLNNNYEQLNDDCPSNLE